MFQCATREIPKGMKKCSFYFYCFLSWLFDQKWKYNFWRMQNGKPFEIISHVGWVTILPSWKGSLVKNMTFIYKCLTVIWFLATQLWRLVTRPTCNTMSNGFYFAILGSYIFISDQKVKAKNNRNRNCIFSFPWTSQGSHIGSFLLCFTYPPQFPLQTDTNINELIEIFLKLSTKIFQVHLIIWTTLVCLQWKSC